MFSNENLDGKSLHETLENLKLALETYERLYKNKTYKFSFKDDTKISMNISNLCLNHLLGFREEFQTTWIGYISKHPFYSTEWLKDFASSEEFISYYIFSKNQNPYVNFEKINYKSSNFKNMNFQENIAFKFEDETPARGVLNLGLVAADKIISIKLKNHKSNCFYDPVSLFVYDNNISDIKLIKNIDFPIKSKFIKKKREFSLNDIYTSECKEETKELIKKLLK